MQQRVLLPEWMDDPDLDERDHFLALRGLQRLNRWSRLTDLVWQPIAQLAETDTQRPLSVLDLATGSADVPIGLCERAAGKSLDLKVSACDVSPKAVRFAADQCRSRKADVTLFELDVLNDPIPQHYDIITCTTFLHHLSDDQTTVVLQKIIEAARRRVIVVDLLRGRLNWLQVWMATRLLSRSPVVHYDGPQSIRAAYTKKEFEQLVRPMDLDRFQLSTSWPCRFLFVGDKVD